ncbi:tyrosyl-tRNA synthetase-like protein [Clohesyomyces aquaticus]|uniref:Tyrosine--tRNA ligase n=1 Tax=Clohesyomyces aquaticus TaxID=1231657 RepID=A0A1Y2AC95_9PLEO|nr:tyrosyl-tRNA synthetase-like protein [Clohesyomyces aquaticus]
MSLLLHLPRPRPYICQQCIRKSRRLLPPPRRMMWAAEKPTKEVVWSEQARHIRAGTQKSMLQILEERGLVKDVAGGRDALDWLLTEKPIGVYVGVDPTAPSLHVGHLLPLMVMYWMYLHGYYMVALVGGGTVKIGDPSGRSSARKHQTADAQYLNLRSMRPQLRRLANCVKALGIKHKYPMEISRKRDVMNNERWLGHLNSIQLMRDVGSGMRLGSMLNRDSVKMRMESGDGMALSEFCYPLFQGYDWWHLYREHDVQLQVGGSDQYGNICAGMDVVQHLRKLYPDEKTDSMGEEPLLTAPFGLTTPLLTTASGEKFGKSAGNAVWLDRDLMSSFDLYQYFLRTSDDDVERYLKLFTFIPLDHISLVMEAQRQDASQRQAQHLLAKEVVELAHGATSAKYAELAHKEAFAHGPHMFSLSILRRSLEENPWNPKAEETKQEMTRKEILEQKLMNYKKEFAVSSTPRPASTATTTTKTDQGSNIMILPNSLIQTGAFHHLLRAAGLVASNSEARQLIQKQGAYVVRPNSGSDDNPTGLLWDTISPEMKPAHYLVDFHAIVLRAGKTKIQVCRVVDDKDFKTEGLACSVWSELREKQQQTENKEQTEDKEQTKNEEHTDYENPAENKEKAGQ